MVAEGGRAGRGGDASASQTVAERVGVGLGRRGPSACAGLPQGRSRPGRRSAEEPLAAAAVGPATLERLGSATAQGRLSSGSTASSGQHLQQRGSRSSGRAGRLSFTVRAALAPRPERARGPKVSVPGPGIFRLSAPLPGHGAGKAWLGRGRLDRGRGPDTSPAAPAARRRLNLSCPRRPPSSRRSSTGNSRRAPALG